MAPAHRRATSTREHPYFDPERADIAHILRTSETDAERRVLLKLSVPPGSRWRLTQSLIDAYNLETESVDVLECGRLQTTEGTLTIPVDLRNLAVALVCLKRE